MFQDFAGPRMAPTDCCEGFQRAGRESERATRWAALKKECSLDGSVLSVAGARKPLLPFITLFVGDLGKEKFTIAYIFRNGELIKANPKERIQQGDTLIIVSPVEEVQNVDRLF